MSTVVLVLLFGACISAVSVPLPSMLCSLAQWFWVFYFSMNFHFISKWINGSEVCQPPDSSLRGWYKWDEVKKSIHVTPGAVGWMWRNTLNTWCGRADINVDNTAVPQWGAQFRKSRPPCWLLRAQADFRWSFKVHSKGHKNWGLRKQPDLLESEGPVSPALNGPASQRRRLQVKARRLTVPAMQRWGASYELSSHWERLHLRG